MFLRPTFLCGCEQQQVFAHRSAVSNGCLVQPAFTASFLLSAPWQTKSKTIRTPLTVLLRSGLYIGGIYVGLLGPGLWSGTRRVKTARWVETRHAAVQKTHPGTKLRYSMRYLLATRQTVWSACCSTRACSRSCLRASAGMLLDRYQLTKLPESFGQLVARPEPAHRVA